MARSTARDWRGSTSPSIVAATLVLALSNRDLFALLNSAVAFLVGSSPHAPIAPYIALCVVVIAAALIVAHLTGHLFKLLRGDSSR